eukprot:evm.model.scf_1566.5 EVM.evm.TU.scf_1566.5   scf_1566:36351-37286(+)
MARAPGPGWPAQRWVDWGARRLAPVGMMPFSGLWFSDRADEVRFAEYYAWSAFRGRDALWRTLRVFGLPLHAATRIRRDGVSWSALTAVVVMAALLSVDYLALAWRVNAPGRGHVRNRLVLVERCFVCIAIPLLLPVWFREPMASPLALPRFLLMNTSTWSLVAFALGMQLLTKRHLAVQALYVLVLLGARVPSSSCVVADSTPEGSFYVLTTWRAVEGALAGAGGEGTPSVQECCSHIVKVMYVLVGWFLPSYALWALEYGARAKFSRTCAVQWEPLTLRLVAAHGVIAAVLAGCLWLGLHPRLWPASGT